MESKHRFKWAAGAAVILAGSMLLYERQINRTQHNEPLPSAQRAESHLKNISWQAFFKPTQDCLSPNTAQHVHLCAAREQRARQRFELSRTAGQVQAR